MPETLAHSDFDFIATDRPAAAAIPKKKRKALSKSHEKNSSWLGRLVRRLILARPLRTLAGGIFVLLTTYIVVNAVGLQKHVHRSALIASEGAAVETTDRAKLVQLAVPPVPQPLPRSQPTAANDSIETIINASVPSPPPIAKAPPQTMNQLIASVSTGPVLAADPGHETRGGDAIAQLLRPRLQETFDGVDPTVMEVQKSLVKHGFNLQPDGKLGVGTKQAIEKFEKEHNMPITGEISVRLRRALIQQNARAR